MKRAFAFLVAATAMLCLAVACGPDEPEVRTVSLSPSSVEIPGQGGSQSVSVNTTGVWNVVSADSWISVSPSSGNGAGSLQVTAAENPESGSRSGSVVISTGTSKATLQVTQQYYDKYSDISTVRSMYKGADLTISQDIWIKGTVVSNYRHSDNGGLNNNTSQKGIVIQDGSAGIQLFCSANNTDFAFGDVVEVSLKGQKLSEYNSLLQVNGIPLANIKKVGTATPTPKEITAKELCSGNYESQYVAVKDVQVASADLGKTFATSSNHTSINMVSKDGDKFLLFTSKYATFLGDKVPEGSGTLKGIACIFYDSYQIILAQKDDAKGLTGARFSSGGEFLLGESSASVDGFADTLTISLVANVEWTATSSNPDFVVTPSKGNSTSLEVQKILVTYGENPSKTETRTATITFKTDADVAKQTLTFTIYQDPLADAKSDEVMPWMELPKIEAQEGFVYINHDYTYYGKTYRNFSIWYDCRNKYSQWVAYPLYQMSSSVSRTDEWEYDPKVPKRYQPQLYNAFGVSNIGRGHQIPSADRLHCDEANKQTFFFTNLTAQNGDLNGGIWANLENKVREWAGACDTVYVVTGALAQTPEDKNITFYTDNIGKPVAVPKVYFKALLRYNKKNPANGGYDAIAFIYENRGYSYTNPVSSDAMSIDELEKYTGFDFFHNLPDEIEKVVEASVTLSDWGFSN